MAIVREENRIDQFGFTTRKLRNECNIELVITQTLEQMLDALIDLAVIEFLFIEPATVIAYRVHQCLTPLCVSSKLVSKFVFSHGLP